MKISKITANIGKKINGKISQIKNKVQPDKINDMTSQLNKSAHDTYVNSLPVEKQVEMRIAESVTSNPLKNTISKIFK